MRKFSIAFISLITFSLIMDFVWMIECVYPLGNFMRSILGQMGTLLGQIFGTIALVGNALIIIFIIYVLWTELFDKFIK